LHAPRAVHGSNHPPAYLGQDRALARGVLSGWNHTSGSFTTKMRAVSRSVTSGLARNSQGSRWLAGTPLPSEMTGARAPRYSAPLSVQRPHQKRDTKTCPRRQGAGMGVPRPNSAHRDQAIAAKCHGELCDFLPGLMAKLGLDLLCSQRIAASDLDRQLQGLAVNRLHVPKRVVRPRSSCHRPRHTR
jgi:hypothetical protein